MDSPKQEMIKCGMSCHYFIDNYAWFYDGPRSVWFQVKLWPAQIYVLNEILQNKLFATLKARQLGITTLCLGYALWLMLFRPAATVMVFSRRDDEAIELLARVKKAYERLPVWMQARAVLVQNKHEWLLSNGSRGLAFPTTPGSARSFSATFALIDEADFVPDLSEFMAGIGPTIRAGTAQLGLITTVDKTKPQSPFKSLFRDAYAGLNNYKAIFLPWWSRPDRTAKWYRDVSRDMISENAGNTDTLWQEYPATVEEALAMKDSDKRFALGWITQCFAELSPLQAGPALPGLTIYRAPIPGAVYVCGADPAEGNPQSDDSVAIWVDSETWEEVAILIGKIEPDTFAQQIKQVSDYYGGCSVLPERNNHGHALIMRLGDLDVTVLNGHDDKEGWVQSSKSKPLLVDFAAEVLRDNECEIHSQVVKQQLIDLEGETLEAPEGLHDDAGLAFMLAIMGCRWVQAMEPVLSISQVKISELAEFDLDNREIVWGLHEGIEADQSGVYSRAVVFAQLADKGRRLHIFGESYMPIERRVDEVLRGQEWPDWVAVSKSATDTRKALLNESFYLRSGFTNLDEGIRNGRRMIKHVIIHPDCTHLIRGISRWVFAPNKTTPLHKYEHAPLALLHLLWALRTEVTWAETETKTADRKPN